MIKNSFLKNAVRFLPLLVAYIIVVFVFSSDVLIGDETRHLQYATNLIDGYYTQAANPEFRNGPGYPLVLALALSLKLPYIAIKLINTLFLLFAAVFFYKTLAVYLKPVHALVLSYFLALYPPVLKWSIYLYSESFALFLVCGFLYFFLKLHREASSKTFNRIISALFLGMLALTKVIFGYVVVSTLLFCSVYYLFKRSKKVRNGILVLMGSFMLCLPYLLYTYSMTGKAFLWGTGGGEILYWRSTPYPDEYGDWINKDLILGHYKGGDYYDTSQLIENHRPFIESLESYSIVQRDSIYKQKAIDQMMDYPVKYLRNTGASALRLFFNYPYSYTPQKTTTYFYIVPNMFLCVFLFLAILLTIRNPAGIPAEVRFLALFSLIFIGGLILLDGHVRHLLPILPILLFYIIFVGKKLIRIETKT